MSNEWNHNTYYHKFLLGKLPIHCGLALDVGSGLGLFSSRLSFKFNEVISLEPDRNSIEYSMRENKERSNINYINDSFIDYDFKDMKFDYICLVASIHHMNFEAALDKLKKLLNPNGRIAILGLYKESSLTDFIISMVAIIPNLIKSAQSDIAEGKCEMVTANPLLSIKELKQIASKHLGEYQFKRHLFWRYSIIFDNKN